LIWTIGKQTLSILVYLAAPELANDEVVAWFWEIVRDNFDQEMKACLLQFVTGTLGFPSRGFSVLQGNDGNIKTFSIHGVSSDVYTSYPRAHQ
jgi:hypothetical protein